VRLFEAGQREKPLSRRKTIGDATKYPTEWRHRLVCRQPRAFRPSAACADKGRQGPPSFGLDGYARIGSRTGSGRKLSSWAVADESASFWTAPNGLGRRDPRRSLCLQIAGLQPSPGKIGGSVAVRKCRDPRPTSPARAGSASAGRVSVGEFRRPRRDADDFDYWTTTTPPRQCDKKKTYVEGRASPTAAVVLRRPPQGGAAKPVVL